MTKYFRGMPRLLVFVWRRERITAAIWLVSLTATLAAIAGAYAGLYSDPVELMSMAVFFENPAMLAMLGPLFGVDNLTVGSLFSSSILLFTALAVALMNIFFVVRNTRGDEERGRTELIRSLPVGRLAGLGSILIAAVCMNFVLMLMVGFVLPLLQIDTIGWGGSLLLGACLGVTGIFFAALTAAFAQASANARSVSGMALGALGVFYILRALGDAGNEFFSMISPLGIILRAQCYVKNLFWPVPVVIGLAIMLTALAFWLNHIRDLGQGLLPQRNGRGEASKLLRTHEGLALRLLRNTAIAWAVGLFLVAISYGAVLGDIESFINGNEFLANALVPPEGHTRTEMFITIIISMIAIAATIPSAGAVLKLVNEERRHRYENIYATATTRMRILAGYLIIGFAESAVLLFLSALGLWVSSAAVMSEPIAFGSMLSAIAVYLPAVWVVIGMAAALSGLFPAKAAAVVYGYLGFSFMAVYMGAILNLPDWLVNLTPFGIVPQLPFEKVNFWILSLTTVAAAALSIAGFVLYRRRDT